MCVQINKTKTVSEYLGWDLSSMATNLQDFAIYQDYKKQYLSSLKLVLKPNPKLKHGLARKLKPDYYKYSPTNPEKEILITHNSTILKTFDSNKREIAGTQYVWTKHGFPETYTEEIVEDQKLGGIDIQWENFPQIPTKEQLWKRKNTPFRNWYIRRHRLDTAFP